MGNAPLQPEGGTAIVLMAGGQASRFPGKLEHAIGGVPMLARCYESVRAAGWPVYIAAKESFSRELDARLDAPLLIDRWPGGGPLAAFLSACATIGAERIFAIAADQPQLEARVLLRLFASWESGDEAVVPEHDGRIEPLAALYARRAVLREGSDLCRTGKVAMRDLIASLATRRVPLEAEYFHNVNSFGDLP